MKYYEKLEDYLNSRDRNIHGNSIPVMDRRVRGYESAISRIILQCLSEITIDLGIKRFMLVLKGKKSHFILKYKLDRLKNICNVFKLYRRTVKNYNRFNN